MTSFEIARDLVLLSLGVIGTSLSIYNLFELRGRGLRRVRVFTETAYLTSPQGELSKPFLKVVATNSGHRDVTITNLGIEVVGLGVIANIGDDAIPMMPDTKTPTKLSDGDLAHRFYTYSSISGAIRGAKWSGKVDIKPFVVDTSGKRHYGKRMKWDADSWED